jgi:hypothetical protein
MLSSPTSVGLRYGLDAFNATEVFWTAWLGDLGLGTRFAFRIGQRFCLPASSPYDVRTGTTNGPAHRPHCVSPSLARRGIGMLTDCPSPTPRGLGLGPTNPMRTDLASETLGLRRSRFSRDSRYSCRHSHFRVLRRSLRYGFVARGTLPYCTWRTFVR